MELDDIDTVAKAIVGLQFGQMPVGLARQRLNLLAADAGARLSQVIVCPVGLEHLHSFDQRGVGSIRVVIDEAAGLVQTSCVSKTASTSGSCSLFEPIQPLSALAAP
jgi:hypothetical protein